MPPCIRNDILNAVSRGEEKYLEMRRSRLYDKTTRISATIHRINLKTMRSTKNKETSQAKSIKETNIIERTIEIARDHGLSTDDLLTYDLAPSPLLFDDDGSMTKPTKSVLIRELETCLKHEDYSYGHQRNSAFIVDVMANIRKVQTAKLSTFDDLLSMFLTTTSKYHEFGQCHYVFDMYSTESTVKDIERKRRCENVPIEYSAITGATPVPKDWTTFWPSSSNKLLVEKLAYSHLRRHSSGNYATILGRVTKEDDWEGIKIHQGTEGVMTNLQSTVFDEADLRIAVHVLEALKEGHTICVVISSDTDVIVTLLYHMPVYVPAWYSRAMGQSWCWGYQKIHSTSHIVPASGTLMCNVLPAVHSLTGTDITSKVGTRRLL